MINKKMKQCLELNGNKISLQELCVLYKVPYNLALRRYNILPAINGSELLYSLFHQDLIFGVNRYKNYGDNHKLQPINSNRVLFLLNKYEGENIWNDLILLFPLDSEKCETCSSSQIFFEDGRFFYYDEQLKKWKE